MMKRRKVIASLLSLLMLFTLFVPQQSVLAAESGIEVQFNNGNTGTSSNTINAKFKVVNTGGSSINLSQLKLRYYYTKDADKSQTFYCDYSGMMSGGTHTTMTNKITGTIVNMSKSVATADTYIEIGFTSDAGSLAAGGSIEIQTRVSRSDWSNYDQSNDFSYKLAGSNVVWDQVAAYLNGALVFGKSPTEEVQTKDPEISPTTASFNKSKPQNITVSLTPNGNSFKGISGLTRNTHYTVSGNTVTLLSSYLSTLALGSKNLTFDFGVTSNPMLRLTITEDVVTDNLEVSIGTVTGNTGDTVTVPVNFTNVAKAGNVGTCNFYIDYDTNLLEAVSVSAGNIVTNPTINFSSRINAGSISFLFLDDTVGDEPITKDGVFANITFKIKGAAGKTASLSFQDSRAFGNGNMNRITGVTFTDGKVTIKDGTPTEELQVTIGTVTGNTGDTVTVPVNFTNVAKAGNVGTCNFYIDYDTNLLEAVSVSAGNIVTNPTINFSSRINVGSISFLFLDDTVGDEPITKDGVFANITFKIKGAAGKTASLSFQDSRAFGNGNMNRITGVSYTDGKVIIEDGIITADLLATIGSGTGSQGNTVIVPITLENVAEVGGIGASNMYITYDATVLEAVAVTAGNTIVNKNNLQSSIEPGSIGIGFIDSTLGDELITIDGVFANITFKLIGAPGAKSDVKFTSETAFGDDRYNDISNVIFTNGSVTIKKVEESGFAVTIETVEAAKGTEVVVPISFSDVAKAGSVGTCNFYLSYDQSLLEAVSVDAGNIITNPSINFSSRINSATGTISFLYLDNTIGEELIIKDGVFAYITFKVLGADGKTAYVKFDEGGAFGDGNMDRITDVIKNDGGVVISSSENPTISPKNDTFDKYTPSNIKITLTPNSNTFIGITGLKKGTDYTVSGNNVTILSSYLSSLDLGLAILTFDFGVDSNPQLALTIKDSTPSGEELSVKVATVVGNIDDIVTVPVMMENVSKAGNVGTCNFYLTYDPALLEPVSVTAGNIITNGPINFASKINTATSTISFLFLDNTIGDELITEDGVFANIQFKVLGKDGQTAKVQFTQDGAFGNGDMVRITKVRFTDGGVVIGSAKEDPAITPIVDTFDKYTPSDITVTLDANGNTFLGITGLSENLDYSVSGNMVTIFESYLSTLPLGGAELTFDFGVIENPTLSLIIKDSTPIEEDSLALTVDTVSGKTGESVFVAITVDDVKKAGNIGAYNFVVTYDSTLLKAVGITDGDILTDKGLAQAFDVSGSAITAEEEASLDSVASRGSMVVAPEYVRPIYLSFNAFDAQELTEDGVLVYIEFEILGKAGDIAAVSINRTGIFENGDRELITNISYTDGGVVIVGEGPLNPSITPNSASFDKYAPSDITVIMTPNDNIFNGINGLVEGIDYSVSKNVVKIFSSYLSTLALGSTILEFDFDGVDNPSIALTIEDTTPVETDFNISIGKVTGNTGDTVIVPVTIGNISKVNNVGTCNFYISYNTSLLQAVSVSAGDIIVNAPINFSSRIREGSISCLYLDNTIGDELITEDGVMLTITFKILGTESEETPIAFEEGGAFGDGNMDRINEIKKINGSVKIN